MKNKTKEFEDEILREFRKMKDRIDIENIHYAEIGDSRFLSRILEVQLDIRDLLIEIKQEILKEEKKQ